MTDTLKSTDAFEQFVIESTREIIHAVLQMHMEAELNFVCFTFCETDDPRPEVATRLLLHSDKAAITAFTTLIEGLRRLARDDRKELRILCDELDKTLEQVCETLANAQENKPQ